MPKPDTEFCLSILVRFALLRPACWRYGWAHRPLLLKFSPLCRKDFSRQLKSQIKQRAWLSHDIAQHGGKKSCLCNRNKNGKHMDQKPWDSFQMSVIAARLCINSCSLILCSLPSMYFSSKKKIWILFTCLQNYIWRLLSKDKTQKWWL